MRGDEYKIEAYTWDLDFPSFLGYFSLNDLNVHVLLLNFYLQAPLDSYDYSN